MRFCRHVQTKFASGKKDFEAKVIMRKMSTGNKRVHDTGCVVPRYLVKAFGNVIARYYYTLNRTATSAAAKPC